MSWRLMEQVLDLRLPDEQERVLVRLARYAADDGTRCFPGVATLAEQTGRSERSVQRVLRVLEGRRYIVPVANATGGRGRRAEYRVVLPCPGKGDTHVTLSGSQTASPAPPFDPERVTPVPPIPPETVTPVTSFDLERVTPTTPFGQERVAPVAGKGDTGDASPSPPTTPLSPSGTDPEEITPEPVGASPAATTAAAPDQSAILRSLSAGAREILDWHRQCHGRRAPAKLTPASAEVLEAAVADLGVERLRESVKFMAAKIPPVAELSKAINAARTKRGLDEGKPLPRRQGDRQHAGAAGTGAPAAKRAPVSMKVY